MVAPSARTGRRRLWLAMILLVYGTLASAYALRTPAWQVPDEPAHYNYVRYIAEARQLPELRPGDYPGAYLEEIKSARFAPSYSIEPIRYESHQPPLYYVLATPVFLAARAAGVAVPLLPLRLFSVSLGAVTLLLTYALMRSLYPQDDQLALGAVACMALVPMQLAITGAVNNDGLVMLLLTLLVWQLVVIDSAWSWGRAALLGLLVGLALLTKLQAYIAAPLVFLSWAWSLYRARRRRDRLAPLLGQGALAAAVAALLVAPWLARNAQVYGPGDLLAMVRHEQVTSGQLATSALLAEHGLPATLRMLLETTFHSFWGQFGWMALPLPRRVYALLGAAVLLAALGLLDRAITARGKPRPQSVYRALLLGCWAAFTTAGFGWYNLQVVQHQGRYLFPALPVWSLLLVSGWLQLYQRGPRWIVALAGLGAAALLAIGVIRQDVPSLGIALLLGGAALVLLGNRLERRWPGVPLLGTLLALALLAEWCLSSLLPALAP
ncbi:MAG: DUF2142 domain-containing protein [Anaerolineae bacterium]|jgi:4-amino-4-deoxy-L-arabinose transferase-like glycosyltransferase|nr:DUF2142 domain-containing protein [Chloroflexota bacterium]